MKAHLAAICILVCHASGLSAATLDGSIEARSLPRLVAGFPMPLRLVVTGPVQMVPSSPLWQTSEIEWCLTVTGGSAREYIAEQRATQSDNSDKRDLHEPRSPEAGHEVSPVTVTAGQTSEFTVDLTQLRIREKDTGHGTRYIEPRAVVQGNMAIAAILTPAPVIMQRTVIEIAAPNATEARFLDQLAAATHLPDTRWEAFVVHSEDVLAGVNVNSLSDDARSQLQYHLILARLVRDPAPLNQLSILASELDGLWEGYEPDVWILQYEIALAKGQATEAAQFRSQVLARRPLATPLMDYVRDHRGVIATYRADRAP